MNHTLPTNDSHPTAADNNIFATIHKSIRRGLADLLTRLGTTDYEDDAALQTATDELESLLRYCESHLEHEERFVRPACGERVLPEALDRGHPQHLRMIAELRALARAVRSTPRGRRAAYGHTLYLHFGGFVADCLQHMAEEERVLLPLMLRVLGAAEVLAVRERIVASLSPAEQLESARRMLAATDPRERRALTSAMLAQAPGSVVMQLVASVEPALGGAAFAELVRLVEDHAHPH